MHLEFTLIFATNVVGSLDIRASREVFPIEVRSPEMSEKGSIILVAELLICGIDLDTYTID